MREPAQATESRSEAWYASLAWRSRAVATSRRRSTPGRQFASWLIAILADIVVLNLFVEHVDSVVIDSFSITILTAVVLRALLFATLALEHRVSAFFKARPGTLSAILRVLSVWLILFGSKFVILEVIDVIFRDHVELGGFLLIIALVAAMIVVEQALQRIYDRL